jgi:hypothetical protein
MENGTGAVKNNMQWKELKTELLYYPAIPLLGIYPKEFKAEYHRSICNTDIHSSVIHNS